MSLQNLANQMQSTGRGGDTMLVHMNPKEVAGLQQLAMAHGGSLTINPQTGLPEAGFLSSLLPTVLGMALAPATGGASLGLTEAWQTAALVGAGTGLMTGSLKKGLMAGLGAFGGASMAPGIMSAGASAAPAVAPNVVAPAQALTSVGLPGPATAAAATNAATGASLGIQPNYFVQGAAANPTLTAGQSFGANNLVQQQAQQAAVQNELAKNAVGAVNGPPSVMQQFGSGLKNIITNQDGAGSRFVDENKKNLLSTGISMLMSPEEKEAEKKRKEEEQYVFHRWPSNYSRQQLSDRPAGSTSERTYFAADGGMVPGPRESGTVEQMSQMNAVGDNTRYPMASQTTPTYAAPAERPISQNVIYPATDEPVDSYTGMPTGKMMASGGIASLAAFAPGGSVGFKSKLAAVKAPTKVAPKTTDTSKLETAIKAAQKYGSSEEQTNKYNDLTNQIKDRQNEKASKAKELADRQKSYAADLKRMQSEQAARVKDLNTEYGNKVKDFNADTQKELKSRQADIKNTKDKNEQKQKQAELAEWQKGRANDLANINKDKTNAINDAGNDIKNFTNDFNNYKNEIATFNKDADTQISTLAKDQATAKQYAGLAKTREGQEKQFEDTKSANQKLLDKANEDFEAATNKYTDYQNALKDEKAKWEEETKRTTSGIAARGAYTKAPGNETAADLQSRIDYIVKHPEGAGGMGATYLTKEQKDQVAKLKDQLTSASNTKVYNPATGQYEANTTKTYQELKAAPSYDTTKKIQEEDNVRQIFEELTGRSPTQDELKQFGFGKNMSDQDVVNAITNKKSGLAELNMTAQFSDDDLNDQAKYYWGRAMTKGELAYFKDPANKITNFNALRSVMQNNPAYLQNLNKINQAAFNKEQTAAQVAMEGPVTKEQVSSLYQDLFGKPPTDEQLSAALSSGASKSQLTAQLKASPEYSAKMTQPLVPEVKQTTAGIPAINTGPAMTQERMNALLAAYNTAPAGGQQTADQLGLAPLVKGTTGQGGYVFNQPQQEASIAGALPYQDIINRLGIGGVYQQIADKAPALQPGAQFNVAQGYTPIGQTARPMADGGYAGGGYHLGDYSDGGRLLKGPGDGVSDSIPASIGNKQPARLADGEFVIPARIVSELGNGSTEAGARQLYAMMDRVQKKRRATVGKGKVAVNSRAHQVLPA